MFAAMAAEAGCRLDEIVAMAATLPGRFEQHSRDDPAHNVWLDDSGAFAAACRPMGILPEDGSDSQPFVDNELIFVCRARLDDRAGLLQQLHIDAVRGATLSDSDILRRCYKKWREKTPQYVYGDFAFVAWERWSRRTVAATDHLGNFRLFYCRAAGRILLATQLGALLACPDVRAILDPKFLALMAADNLDPGCTMFQGIRALNGGELLIHQDEMIRIDRWWRPDTAPREVHSQIRDYVEEARTLFESAVVSRLRARGGVVATLGGGLDSTLVAATAARHMAISGKVLEAFTAISQPGLPLAPRPAQDDDLPWATAVAEFQPNIRQRLVSPEGMTPLEILPIVHAAGHTPAGNVANMVWEWQMSARAARNRARVVLCADRGNRSIGYSGDLSDAHFIRLRQFAGAAQRTLDRVRCIGVTPHPAIAATEAALQDVPEPRQLFARAMMASQPASRIDYMAQFGVEWLDPTADRKLLERLLTFPLHVFRVGNRPRGLARELGRGILPDSVRLRCARAVHLPDPLAWIALRASDYRTILQSIRASNVCATFLDIAAVESKLEALCIGSGTAEDAQIVHRAFDTALFAMAVESRQGLTPNHALETSQTVPTLRPTALSIHEPSSSQHRSDAPI